jgi:acetyltransferase-like isoleucine patch superfamily enzyme
MTTNYLKMEVERTPETLYISNIPQTSDSVKHYICIINQPLSQTFIRSITSYQSCFLSKPCAFSYYETLRIYTGCCKRSPWHYRTHCDRYDATQNDVRWKYITRAQFSDDCR